jgi:hypothetical protein
MKVCKKFTLLLAMLLAFSLSSFAVSITIVDQGGTPPANLSGGGNLHDTAVDAGKYFTSVLWANKLLLTGTKYPNNSSGTVKSNNADFTINVRWDDNGVCGDAAACVISNARYANAPYQLLSATIYVNNTGVQAYFTDSNMTDHPIWPHHQTTGGFSEHYTTYADWGSQGGLINDANYYTSNGTVMPWGSLDLLSVLLHEMMHAIGGLSYSNSYWSSLALTAYNNNTYVPQKPPKWGQTQATAYMAGNTGNELWKWTSYPGNSNFYGTQLWFASNNSGPVGHLDCLVYAYGQVSSGINADERRLPSALDFAALQTFTGMYITWEPFWMPLMFIDR